MIIKSFRVLLAEDDVNLGQILKEYLEIKNYEVVLCQNGQEAYETYKKNEFHLCIFDIMMPLKDGLTLAKDIRIIDKKIPIIFLTAKALKEDKIEGFETGADDYVVKPFSMEELLLRIKAITRRTYEQYVYSKDNEIINFGGFIFEPSRQLLIHKKMQQKLTTKESELLYVLCANINLVVERTLILKMIWKNDSHYNARSMDVFISRIRKYLSLDPDVQLINCHGTGYKLLVNKAK
jgi:two-component system, OmpR family, response regulator VicR